MAALAAALISCSRNTRSSTQRIAILPANVLIDDPSSEWLKTAVPLVLQEDLATSRKYVPSVTAGESGAYEIAATAFLRMTVETRAGRTRIQAIITDSNTQKNTGVVDVAGPSQVGFIAAVNALAKRLDGQATSYSTSNDRALQVFSTAAQTPDVAARAKLMSEAIGIDPNFGFAYVALAELAITTGQNVQPLLSQAAAHRAHFTPLDRARLDFVSVRAAHAPLPEQEKALRAVLELAPSNVEVLTNLAADCFLQNDAKEGAQFLERAMQLNPNNINLRKQLAEGLLATRRYAEAEKVFTSIESNATILPELAVCIFLEGDTRRADSVIDRFISSRPAGDSVSKLFRAEWFAISGRRSQAMAQLRDANFGNESLNALALAQLAIWQVMDKNFAEAQKTAGAAQPHQQQSAIASYLAQSNVGADQLRQQVGSSNGAAGQILLAYGLFLHGFYPDAAQVWKTILESSGNADLRARAMLASSLEHAGRSSDAHGILVQPFVPEFGDLYAAISFDEMRRLLGK